MPVLMCPRCQRANPVGAIYCYFDGGALGSQQDGNQRLPHDFIFPSGRRCSTVQDFASGCQDEWANAKDLLTKDAFRQYFTSLGRHDLARIAQESTQQANADMALSRFLDSLPVVRANVPKLDLQPRRYFLGRLPAAEPRELELILVNQGKGTLQGAVTVSEGGDWLSLEGGAKEVRVGAAKEQRVKLKIDTQNLQSAQTYMGQLAVVTSGGVVEVPIRFELVARPFAKAPFQGVRTPRELAEKMRVHPKQAGPMLESGDVERWFQTNNWSYPVEGAIAKGLAGVQQFFEAMGLSKPPALQLSQKEVHFTTHYPDSVRFQVALQTPSRKWVYGQVTSSAPWLLVLTPKVIGPQHANILLEADPKQVATFPPDACLVNVKGNGGQKLELRVALEVKDAPRPVIRGQWMPVLVFATLFVLIRLLLIPVVDFHARGEALRGAAERIGLEMNALAPVTSPAGWLSLPWVPLLAGTDAPVEMFRMPADRPIAEVAIQVRDFRHHFLKVFIGTVTWWTWLPMALVFVGAVLRHGKTEEGGGWRNNLVPGIVAGTVAGVLSAATLACLFLAVELGPHVVWAATFGRTSALQLFTLWLVVALAGWAAAGAFVGVVVAMFPLLREAAYPVPQRMVAGLFRWCGLERLRKMIVPAAG